MAGVHEGTRNRHSGGERGKEVMSGIGLLILPVVIMLVFTVLWSMVLTIRNSKKMIEYKEEYNTAGDLMNVITGATEVKEWTIERGEEKPALVFTGRCLGRTNGGHIAVYESEDSFYILENGYLYPSGVYSFAFPTELKGHIRLTKEIIDLFRNLKTYNPEFGEVVEEKLENPLIKEFMTRKMEVPVKVVSRRIEDGEVPSAQRKDAEVVRSTQGTAREVEGTGS
jgi:hypothetical protein